MQLAALSHFQDVGVVHTGSEAGVARLLEVVVQVTRVTTESQYHSNIIEDVLYSKILLADWFIETCTGRRTGVFH